MRHQPYIIDSVVLLFVLMALDLTKASKIHSFLVNKTTNGVSGVDLRSKGNTIVRQEVAAIHTLRL